MNPISSRLTSASLLPIPHTISLISAMSFSSSSSKSLKVPTFKEEDEQEKLRQVLKYHNQTKHSFTNYARGPRGLDWANQPNPFRRYLSSPLLPLLHHDSGHDSVLYSSLFDSSSLPPPKPISLSTISHLFLHSLALSAWKTTGASTWPLRVNPSSGNLHPTEAYLISPPIPSLSHLPFVAHYAPKEHSLEVRANLPSSFFPEFFPENSFLIGVSSIFWREAWKYGERAFRYCNHDVGHAIAALAVAAGELGWELKLLDGLGSDDLNVLMNLPEVPEIESEHPDCLLLVFPKGGGRDVVINIDYKGIASAIREGFTSLEWKGTPNVLSKEHLCWDIIHKTAEAVKKPSLVSNSSLIDASCFRGSGVVSRSSYKELTVSPRESSLHCPFVLFLGTVLRFILLFLCIEFRVCPRVCIFW
ncbi:uncharacterized protein LOC106404272 isoform X2 [Brassica napus]|uniref:uncharacterized protein LOC106404272 isoform X2 n=1 Tax=Brassica napus TaxID=3708 RepID=UPI00207868A8|nr:uncharacterized protein LOC106404272 isoform X2 [Brassica napus]